MHTARRTFVATGTVALLAAAGVTAAIAADPAPPPPPRIAFVANGIVPADALAAGPIAGQLGAPIYTTQPDTLSPAAATGLDDYDPELVIVLGGPVAIHDTVIDQVEDATGLSESADATPAGGIVRAAGGDRFDTAAAVADLLAAYNPAYLPIDMQAIDADTLDGQHASDFQPAGDYLAADGKAADSDKLDGLDATAFERPEPYTIQAHDFHPGGGSPGTVAYFANTTQLNSGAGFNFFVTTPDTLFGNGGAPRAELLDIKLCLGSEAGNATSLRLQTEALPGGAEIFLEEFPLNESDDSCTTLTPSSPVIVDDTTRLYVSISTEESATTRVDGLFLRLQPTDEPVPSASGFSASGLHAETSAAESDGS